MRIESEWRQETSGLLDKKKKKDTVDNKMIGILLALSFMAVIFLTVTAMLVFSWKSEEDDRFVQKLGSGWTLGYRLDADGIGQGDAAVTEDESFWNNPESVPQMMADIKAAGYSTVRVPVRWSAHMDERWRVDKAWMNQVQQVVDYGMDAGLYVILSARCEAWYSPEVDDFEDTTEIVYKLWSQIAARFAGYNQRLLFEGIDKPRLAGAEYDGDSGTREARELVNLLNSSFMEAVRSTKGLNYNRYLLIAGYDAGADAEVRQAFRVPKGASRVMMSVQVSSADTVKQQLSQFAVSRLHPVVVMESGQITMIARDGQVLTEPGKGG